MNNAKFNRSSATNLFILTSFYPFGNSTEAAFLKDELIYLKEKFDEVTVVPRYISGAEIPYPSWLRLDRGLTGFLDNSNIRSKFLKLPWKFILRELITARSIRPLLNIKSLYWSASYALVVARWVNQLVSKGKIDLEKSLFYTYWLGDATLGISLIKKSNPKIKLISRAHRIDLYEELRYGQYIPGRYITLEAIDKLFLISDHGKAYLYTKYPEFADCYTVSRLGVKNPGSANINSKDGIFRIVSCSSITQVKRLDHLVMALLELAKRFPDQRLHWDHFGDGELRKQVELMTENFPVSIRVKFWGKVLNKDIYKFYKENSVDLFVNVSDSEGIPVSIMEAQSFGIPVLATAVGGTPEIVTNKNGWLIPGNSTASHISNCIASVMDELRHDVTKRSASLETWKNMYDADVNFSAFSESVASI